jgi:hypothetical protein
MIVPCANYFFLIFYFFLFDLHADRLIREYLRYLHYSQTKANDKRQTTTCLQRPLFWSPVFHILRTQEPLNGYYHLKTATILGAQG